MNNIISFKFYDNTLPFSCAATADSVIPILKMTPFKYTKYILNDLAIMKGNGRNQNPTLKSEVT